MKTVYDYIQPPTHNNYDAYSVWHPGMTERVICGRPLHLLSMGWIIFGACSQRLAHYAMTPKEAAKVKVCR